MQIKQVDINCDLGEGMSNDKDIFPFISSCNIACGGHFGNDFSMQQSINLAKANNVKIGAHPSYPDKENFGRESISISNKDLQFSITKQLSSFVRVLKNEKEKLHHIKPHGALYNDIAKDYRLANVFLKSIQNYKSSSYLYVPYASIISKLAIEQGYKIKHEVFIDRAYNTDYSLVSRKLPKAILESEEEVFKQVLSIAKKNKIVTVSGLELTLETDTFCLHGDNANALKILEYLSKELPKHNIMIQR